MVTNNNLSNEVKREKELKTPPELIEKTKDKYMTLKDGTDISFISDFLFRYRIHTVTLQQLRQYKRAYLTTKEYYDLVQQNNSFRIISGDYLMPDNDSNVIWGFVIQVRCRNDGAREIMYLDVCIGDETPKTIRCELSTFSDPMRRALIKRYGWKYNINDLVFSLIRVRYTNKKDEKGNTYFSVIEDIYIDIDELMYNVLEETYCKLIGE